MKEAFGQRLIGKTQARAAKLVAALVFTLALVPAFAETIAGRVVKVIDGDTIDVLRGQQVLRVRLAAIDAPERGQAFWRRSAQNLSRLVAGREVVVKSHKRDRYQRSVGKVLLDGQDVCLEQLHGGLAWHAKEFAHEQGPEDRGAYQQAEAQSREARRGLWSTEGAVPPWQYRRAGKM